VDVDVPAADLDVVDGETDESLALVEVEVVDAGGDAGGEVVDAAAEPVIGGEFVALGDDSVALGGHAPLAIGEVSAPALGFGEIENAGLVEVGQSSPFGVGGVEAALEPVELGGEELVVGSGGAGEDGLFPGEEQVGAEQRGPDLIEHELIEGVGPDVAFSTAAPGAALDGVAVEAFVVADEGVVGATSAAVGGSAGAAGADDETAQQPAFFVGVETAGGEVGVLGAGSGRSLEGGLVDDGRAGHQDPLLPGTAHLAGGPPGVGFHLGAVEVEAPDVDLPAQHPPDGPGRPASPGGGRDVGVVEPAGDLADGAATGDVVVEDAPDHGGLFLVDDEVGEALPGAGDAQVAVGGPPAHRLTGPGPEQLAPPGPFGDLGPFVLGDDGLDLGEEPGLGVAVHVGRVEVADDHTVAGELVGDEHLVGVGAGQAVGSEAPQRLDETGLGGVAQGIEPGPVQTGAGDTVVEVLANQVVAVGRHPGPQRLELGTDGPSGFLGVGRHPGVDPDPHDPTPCIERRGGSPAVMTNP
jgi:hypothetical protein